MFDLVPLGMMEPEIIRNEELTWGFLCKLSNRFHFYCDYCALVIVLSFASFIPKKMEYYPVLL